MQTIFKLDADTWYPEDALRMMGIDGDHLKAAREAGELRFTDRGGIVRYKGRWVLDWLEGNNDSDSE